MTYTITREDGADDAAALRYALEFASVKHSTHSTALRALADSIEEQVKPAVEEPKEFGSIVRAVCLGGTDPQLWQRSYGDGKHYWESETGVVDVWSDLTDVEVLRVGLGEPVNVHTFMTEAGFDSTPAQDDAYVLGAADMKARARKQFIQLASSAITSERKEAWRQAIEALEALS